MNIVQRSNPWWRIIGMVFIALTLTSEFLAAIAGDIKIGVVNTEKILRESLPAIQAQKKIEQEFVPRDEDIKKNGCTS